MNPPKNKRETPLQKYLFYKAQVCFQILTAVALLIGTVILRSVFTSYGLPEYLFQIVILVGFSLTILVIGLQAYLHHYTVSKGLFPFSWLSKELKAALSSLNQQTSSKPANIPNLEKSIREVLNTLEHYGEQSREVKNLMETLEQLIELLGRYWQAATRNEVLVAIGRVSAEVAHDLKGPLSSLQVALNQLKEQHSHDKQQQPSLNLLELSSQRLMSVANNLLAKYRGEAQEKTIFSIHQVLDELIGEYQYQEQYNAIKFVKQYHSGDLYLEGDRNAIQRVLGNLVKNAAEAMQFEGKITLKTKKVDNKMVVEVVDTGCGIPEGKLDKIFGDYTGKADGHGIGLQFVKKTASAHGGRVRVESVFGEGSCFFVELPLTSKEATSIGQFTLELEEQKTSIVIIDDDPSMLEQWRIVLKDLHIEAGTYLSYEAFAEKIKDPSPVTTAIIDYHFDNSELNGFQIIEKLRKEGFKHLYLCTAEYWKPSLKEEALELGVKICPKPLPEIKLRTKDQGLGTTDQKRGEEKGEGKSYTVLVIDDEASVRLCWQVIREKLSIDKLYCYPNMESLLAEKVDFKTIDIAFVDKNIRNSDYKGSDVVNYLKLNGVAKVALASGESEKKLRQDPDFSQVDFILNDKIPKSFKEFFS